MNRDEGTRPARGRYRPRVRRSCALSGIFTLQRLEARLCLTVPAYSSLPGANHTIYLDFDGHVTTGTQWNTYDFDRDGNITEHATINSPAYDTDGNLAAFSSAELADIQTAWQRISEDYAPFQVNVTTVDPGVNALIKSGSTDTQWGVRVVITRDNQGSGAGGIAWVGSFNWSSDTPAFVYVTGGKNVAEAASHEVGHTLGLSHDGTTSGNAYYYGHGSGVTSWAPIMGVGYSQNVTTWDKGEYYGSNSTGTGANYGRGADDMAVIVNGNGFGYRTDDAGNTLANAAALVASGTTLSGSGLIHNAADLDFFTFTTAAGTVSLNVTPFSPGNNLDVKADLYDAAGVLVASSNASTTLAAALSVSLAAGQYYLAIDGTGVGTPTANPPSGYTDYGSVGRYSITGTRVDPGAMPAFTVSDVSVNESAGTATFSVSLSGTVSSPVTVNFATANGTAASPGDYSVQSGTLSFSAPGTQTVTVPVVNDTTSEPNESFYLRLSGASGAMLADGEGVGTIIDNDVAPTLGISAVSASKAEGTGASINTPFTFRVNRVGTTVGAITVGYSVSSTGGRGWATADDFAGSLYPSGSVTIPDGASFVDVSVNVRGDSTRERDERFRITLGTLPSGYVAGTTQVEGLILNDDGGTGGIGRTRLGRTPAPKLTHHQMEAAGLVPCSFPRPEDVDDWLAHRDHEHDHDHDDTPRVTLARPRNPRELAVAWQESGSATLTLPSPGRRTGAPRR